MIRHGDLGAVLSAADHAGIFIEYVETNSSWYEDELSACRLLETLYNKGLRTFLISISPFHMEFIPFEKVLGVMEACKKTGIRVFPWVDAFTDDLVQFDIQKPHKLEALFKVFGDDYLQQVQKKYWIHLGGRAIDTFGMLYPGKTAREIIQKEEASCAGQLSDTSHFHIDLYGNYIPGLCTGLSISMNDIGKVIPKKHYPLIALLADQGIKGLYDFAVTKGDYKSTKQKFINKCDLCNDIRTYLFQTGAYHKELTPQGYYKE